MANINQIILPESKPLYDSWLLIIVGKSSLIQLFTQYTHFVNEVL